MYFNGREIYIVETKVLLTKKLSDSEIGYIKDSLGDKFNLIVPERFDEEEILKYISDVKILLVDNIKRYHKDKDYINKLNIEKGY